MDNININDLKVPKVDLKKIKLPIFIGLLFLTAFLCFYTVDANENAVVLRLGKFLHTTEPGLHFKIPFIDSIHKVKVDYQWKEEFGFRTNNPGVRTSYSRGTYENESWMLTGNLKIAEVHWVVQYKIRDPFAYLFNLKNVENTIRDVSESTMRLMIGDRSFKEVLQKERIAIANEAKAQMQKVLDIYKSGIQIQMTQLQGVVPPGPVADSFNEVNRAKQEEETLVNEANQAFNKEIYRAEGEAKKLINEAKGFAIERINTAEGDATAFKLLLKEYNKAPQITRDRYFIETMNIVLGNAPNKVIVDTRLENFLPMMNLKNQEKK